MTIDNRFSDNLFKISFFLIGVLYIILYMPYGLEGTDTGYIFGTSWNIYNGEIPHRDYVYTRPAIPAYFHTIFIYISETYGYLLDRCFFYIQVFLYSFLGAKLITQHFSIRSNTILYFLAILAAIFSIHNYPPMGWNTIDGVFFSMIGVYLIVKQNTNRLYLLLGSLSIVLGVLSKQSFYFIPIFLFIYLLLNKDRFRLKFFTLFAVLFVSIYFGFKYYTDSLFPFYEQTFVRTTGSGLMNAGFRTYYLALKFNFLYIIGILLVLWLGLRYINRKYIYLLVNLGIAIYLITVFYHDDFTQWTVIKYIFQLLFIASLGFSAYMLLIKKDKKYLLLILLLTISWSASISNGYQTPIHFSLPFVVSLYLMFNSIQSESLSIYISGGILILFLATFFYGYQTIYRDSPRKELVYDMEEVFPELKFLKSDKETYEKYQELRDLSLEYSNFTVLPALTQAHYLTKTINPIGTDWPLDVEINDEYMRLINELVEKKSTVFVENSGITKEQLEGYQIVKHIEKNWTLIKKGKYFDVYSSVEP